MLVKLTQGNAFVLLYMLVVACNPPRRIAPLCLAAPRILYTTTKTIRLRLFFLALISLSPIFFLLVMVYLAVEAEALPPCCHKDYFTTSCQSRLPFPLTRSPCSLSAPLIIRKSKFFAAAPSFDKSNILGTRHYSLLLFFILLYSTHLPQSCAQSSLNPSQ